MILTAVLASTLLSSQSTESCVQIDLDAAHYARIQTDERSGTHLWFPEEIAYSVVANEQLWEFKAYGQHFFLKPAVDTGDFGAATTLTIITSSRAYDFRVERQSALTNQCYRINHASAAGGLSHTRFGGRAHTNNTAPTTSPAPPPSAPRMVTPPAPALINTAYAFESPILAAWDDGRRTYLRCDGRLPGIEAAIVTGPGGAVVGYTYDQATATYSIDGVHGGLNLVVTGANHPITRVVGHQ